MLLVLGDDDTMLIEEAADDVYDDADEVVGLEDIEEEDTSEPLMLEDIEKVIDDEVVGDAVLLDDGTDGDDVME